MVVRLYWIEAAPGRLAIMARLRGGEWLDEEVRSLKSQGVNILVSLLTTTETAELGLETEATACTSAGIEFHLLPIEDRGVPSDPRQVRRLAEALAAAMRANRAVAIHCRAGIGRSALVAACILAKFGIEPEGAFKRIAEARGCPVPDTDEQRDWVAQFARTSQDMER